MGCSSDTSTWDRSTYGGIPYKLMDGYPQISGSRDGAKAVEKYLIRASDVDGFFAESLPAPTIIFGGFYVPPRRRMPGSGILVTQDIAFAPQSNVGKPGDPLGYDAGATAGTYCDFYEATINYATEFESADNEQDPADPTTFLEHSVTVGGEFLSVPPTNTYVSEGGIGDTEGAKTANRDQTAPIVKTMPTIEHTLKWKLCLNPDWDKIISMLGRVNSVTHEIFFDANPETVMFMGVSGSRSYVWNGASAQVQPWTLDFRFSHKEYQEDGQTYGHNHIYSPKGTMFKRVYRQHEGSGDFLPLHELADLSELFTS